MATLRGGPTQRLRAKERAQRNLRIFAHSLRAVARMRIHARAWAVNKKKHQRLLGQATREGREWGRGGGHGGDDDGTNHGARGSRETEGTGTDRARSRGAKTVSSLGGGSDENDCVVIQNL